MLYMTQRIRLAQFTKAFVLITMYNQMCSIFIESKPALYSICVMCIVGFDCFPLMFETRGGGGSSIVQLPGDVPPKRVCFFVPLV